MDRQKFRGTIFSKYRSVSEFTVEIGWPKNKAHNIISGRYTPDVNECAEFAEFMNLSVQEYLKIFVPDLSPNGEK